MFKDTKRNGEYKIQVGRFLILMLLAVFLLSGCAGTAPNAGESKTVTSSREEVAVTGDVVLIASGLLPAPVLQAGGNRYLLEVTKDSVMPPDMVKGGMIAWGTKGRYYVEGYLYGKIVDFWNPATRQLEKTPVLRVLRLTKSGR